MKQLGLIDLDKGTMNIPRRIDLARLSPAEIAIRSAVLAVEEMPADILLTDAVNLLQQARDKVADYIEGCRCPEGWHEKFTSCKG